MSTAGCRLNGSLRTFSSSRLNSRRSKADVSSCESSGQHLRPNIRRVSDVVKIDTDVWSLHGQFWTFSSSQLNSAGPSNPANGSHLFAGQFLTRDHGMSEIWKIRTFVSSLRGSFQTFSASRLNSPRSTDFVWSLERSEAPLGPVFRPMVFFIMYRRVAEQPG